VHCLSCPSVVYTSLSMHPSRDDSASGLLRFMPPYHNIIDMESNLSQWMKSVGTPLMHFGRLCNKTENGFR